LARDSINEVLQLREISIMDTQSPSQLPYSLDGIQLWTIWRKEIEHDITSVFSNPRLEKLGMMISAIIKDHVNYSFSICPLEEILQEFEISLSVECPVRQGQQPASIDSNSAEYAHALSRGSV